jgi:hypothetical protein
MDRRGLEGRNPTKVQRGFVCSRLEGQVMARVYELLVPASRQVLVPGAQDSQPAESPGSPGWQDPRPQPVAIGA